MAEEMDIFADELVLELLDDAATKAANSSRSTWTGRLTLSLKYLQWVNSHPVEVGKDEFRKLESDKSMEATFAIDIQELRPNLDFTWSRRLMLFSKNWYDHWQSSVMEYYEIEPDASLKTKERQAALNKDVARKTFALNGKYVTIADLDESKPKDPDRPFSVPSLVKVHESQAACFDEYEKRFGTRPVGDAASVVKEAPDGFDSYEEFESIVKDLRDSGMANREIAKEIDVKIIEVVNVK